MSKVAVNSANAVFINALCTEKTIKVLHVDDDADFLAVAKQCLEEQSMFEVDTALSAEQALTKLKDTDYDVVVTDYQMPGKNGLELLREVRQQGKDVPFILFTCKGKEEIAIEALNSGIYRFIGKEGKAEVTYGEMKRTICDTVRENKTEKLFREAENTLRQITENTQDMLLLTDTNLVCTYASASHKWILGYEPEEMVGKSVYDFIHPDDLARAINMAGNAFKDSFGGKMEVRVRRADGSYIFSEGVGKILRDENGQVTGTVLTSRDITERRKIEDALRKSEEKYRKLFEEAMDAIFVADAETGILVDCNRAATELTGKAKSELIGMHQRFLHPPEKSTEKFSGPFKQHLDGKEGNLIESQVITKNGEIRDVAIKGNLFEVNGKKMLRGVFRDITDRKKVEEKICFQSNMLNAVGQAVIATDMNGKIVYWNHAAEQVYGWSKAEMIGHSAMELVPEDHAIMPKGEMEKLLKVEKSFSGEAVFKRRDGERLSVLLNLNLIFNDSGEAVGILNVSTDITEQKWMQEVLNEAVDAVAGLNEKLRVVEGLTRHDIRNKLSAFNGRMYLLKKRCGGNQEVLQQLKEMELTSQQILRILEFERVYSQVGVEELKYVDVKISVDEAVSLFSDLKAVKLTNECHGLKVFADSLLRQLFYNLIDNTLKYGEKTRKIRVRYQEEVNQLKLIYEDDGVGISDDDKRYLFQEGYGKGTGYGLYLIKRICEAYGWAMQETGKEGKGAQFTMTIPKNANDGKRLYEISQAMI